MAHNFSAAQDAVAKGDYEEAAALMARSAGMIPGTLGALRETGRFAGSALGVRPQTVREYLAACFAAGTPILWEGGVKNVEDFHPGERVWTRNEFNPNAPLVLKPIEEVFANYAAIWHVHIGGQIIRTTAEHPFWVKDFGWMETKDLKIGDELLGHDGQALVVEDILETGEWEAVFNFRVAENHTYFVGDPEAWGFSVWAHNASCTGSYSQLYNNSKKPADSQVHHLNQNAAYGRSHAPGGIPYRDGACIYLEVSQHKIFHQKMNEFWNRYRGTILKPTNRQYASAVGKALREASVPEADIRRALAAARKQRLDYGFFDTDPIPNVPRR